MELDSIGGYYTWLNVTQNHYTCTKLDRTFGNENCVARCPNSRPILTYGHTSDYPALHIEFLEHESGNKPFQSYSSWLQIKSFNDIFTNAWKTIVMGSPIYILQQKIKFVKISVKS